MFVFTEGDPDITSRSKDENEKQTQSISDTSSGNRIRATPVGGERSHHCAVSAPLITYSLIFNTVSLSDVDECSSNPCANGGTCVDSVNGYLCQCAEGFADTNCSSSGKPLN